MNVLGVAQGQMVGSFIMKKLYPLYLFFSQGLSGVAQRQIGGSFIRKKLYPLHLFFFDCYGQAQGFSGVLGGSWGQPGANGGQFYPEKAMSTAFIFF